MLYVIYEQDSTKLLSKHTQGGRRTTWKQKGRAERLAQEESMMTGKTWLVAEQAEFHKKIEKTEPRKHLFNDSVFVVPVNTPWTSGPWSETYWSS